MTYGPVKISEGLSGKSVLIKQENDIVGFPKNNAGSICQAIYTAAGMTFPTATPDLTSFQTALATLAEKHSSDQSIEMACIALFEEARKVGLLQPEADALDSVRTSLRDISNDPGLSVSERDKAKRALEAMS